MDFELWLEFEVWRAAGGTDDPESEFFNMQISLADGRKYALNVWTYGALPLAIADSASESDTLGERYLLPPDLFVQWMDRKLLESIVAKLISEGQLRDEWRVITCD